MADLGFDREQLAAALERIVFEEDDVLEAICAVIGGSSAQVGVFPQQGQAQYQVMPTLSAKDDAMVLDVVVFDNDIQPTDPGHCPEFTVALVTRDGQILTSVRAYSHDGTPFEAVPLSKPELLIGARLELVH
jgi:hypothetical protein